MTKRCPKNQLGEPTFGPEGGFGSIFGSLERPKKRRFERKMGDGKKVEKKVVKALASEGHAMAGKEGLDGWDRTCEHAFAPPGAGGRADCLRFASPAEATRGLEAKRL